MGLLNGVVSTVKSVTNTVTNVISPLVGPIANVIGSAGSAATGIAGYIVSVASGVGYAAFPLVGVVTAFLGAVIELTGTMPPSIPFPNPIVKVDTTSGSVNRTSYVPIGGVPVSIDVDNGQVLGVLKPDIAVSVGLVSPNPQGPDTLIQPSIKIQREILAAKSGHVAPPLKINTQIQLKDALNDFKEFATIDYGYDTPPGGRVPPLVLATITGPLTSGFVDPLKAKLEVPGYDAPLQFNIGASTPKLLANFGVKFNPMPHEVNLVEDPRDDGLDAHYDHSGPIPDVKLDANIAMLNREDNTRRDIGASVERLPRSIDLSNTNTADGTFIDFKDDPILRAPDVRATYRDFAANGNLNTDADIRISALPKHITGAIRTTPAAGGGADLDSVDFKVLDGDEIGAVDFLVKNYLGAPGPVPELNLGPRQFVALAQRRLPDATTRFRAAGRIEGIRAANFFRTGADKKGYDVTTDIGSGTKPLRAVFDLDNRGPGAPADAQRFKLNALISPLPRTIHAVFLPGAGASQPTKVTYDSPQVINADADAVIARGTGDACGQALVTCAGARIDKVPTHLALELPGTGGTDYAVSHNGGAATHPDIRATVDNTPDVAADRVWAQIEALRLPNEIRARLATSPEKVLTTAEFHGCAYDYAAASCTSPQGALGRVRFTVRNAPARDAILPRRPDQAPTFVSMIKRPTAYEIQGRVDEIRNVRFRQRDTDHDGKPDGTIGVLVDAGVGGPFDAHVDQLGPDTSRPDPKPDALSIIDAHVAALPTTFSACFREAKESAPGAVAAADADPLLGPCDRRDVLGRADGDLTRTPLSIDYTASAPTAVTASLTGRAVNVDDKTPGGQPIEHTRKIDVNVDKVPAHLRADVLLPTDDDNDASKARPLEARYESSTPIDNVDLTMDDHRTDGTPAPNGTYVEAKLAGVPTRVSAKVDTARKVLRRADFHACDYDFTTETCKDGQQALGAVDFLVRPQRRRGALPAVPPHGASFVSLIKRLANSEITGHVSQIRNVSFRQRDDDGSGEADGTLGVLVDAGSGGAFDAHIDQVAPDENYKTLDPQPTASSQIDAHVNTLGTLLKACVRQANDRTVPLTNSLSADTLMSPCDDDSVLGHGAGTTSTPLTLDYQSTVPTLVSARVQSEAKNKDDGDRRHTSDLAVTIDKVPAALHADVIPGRDVVPASGSDPEQPARATQIQYAASGRIDVLDLRMENRRTDETSSDSDLFAKAHVTGIPANLAAEIDSARDVLRRAEFHACDYNFNSHACDGAESQIDNVQFTVRPKRLRGQLPPAVVPASPTGDFVSLVKRFANSEILGQVHDIRAVAFHQRDDIGGGDDGDKPDGKPDGTLGVEINAGSGKPFDAHIDQVGDDTRDELKPLTVTPRSTQVVDAHVAALPLSFRACLRSPHEGHQGSVSPDDLLADCDDAPISDNGSEPDATPMSLVYRASSTTAVNATVSSKALDTSDLPNPNNPISDGNRPFEHTNNLSVDVSNIPTFLRADIVPSKAPDNPGDPSRRLQVAYSANAKINQVKFSTEDRRSSSLCLDPRSGRQATCFSARITDIPKTLNATFDPDQSRGALDFSSGTPASGDPLLSLHDLVYQATAPDSKGHPLSATADVLGVPGHITGRIAQYDPPGDTKKDLGVVRINACPDGPCDGIGSINFTATNSLVDSALPGVPGSPEPGVTQSFSMVQRGDDFRARGNINNLREVGLSRLTPADDAANAQVTPATVTATKHIRAAFGGASEKLRAYLDTDDGKGSLKVDGIVSDAPNAINLCLRDSVDTSSSDPYLPSGEFCDTAPKNQLAISAGLDTAAPSVKPDIKLYTFRQANASGSKILTGTLSIDDLGARINATVDKGDRGGILVEGRDFSNTLANVAGRVSFDLRNFDGSPGTSYPFGPIGDNLDPADDNRNDDTGSPPNAGRNYVTVGQDGPYLRLRGSIPAIKRVGLAPGACNTNDPRFPDETLPAWGEGRAPSYTCIRAALGAGRPLGFAVRSRKAGAAGNDVLALEEGHINAVPTAGDGLSATIGSSPSVNANLPNCSDHEDLPVETTAIPCKPELISLESTPAGGTPPELEARAFLGPQALVDQLGTTPIADSIGARLDYNKHPRDFEEDGVRVRIGTKKTGDPEPNDSQTAVRVGLKIPIPRWLDVTTPTFYSCARKVISNACEKTTDGDHSRTSATDIFVSLIAADDARFGGTACSGSSCYLGRVALAAHDFDKNTDTIVTGAPPANLGNGTSSATPENPPGPGDYDRGFQLPRHLDARVQMRENHSGDDPRYGTTFIQADMRLNAPVSLMARLAPESTNINRAGNSVPSMTATVRNLAAIGSGAPDYSQPTQRAQIVLKNKEEDPGFFDCGGDGLGISIPALATACLITPHPYTRWINVDLSADPDGAGGNDPARRIEAIVDQTDKNNVELRGYTTATGSTPAKFGVNAGLRLEPFLLGARVGGGIGLVGGYAELDLDGDLIVGTSNNPSSRLRLSNNAGALRLATADGGSNVDVDLREGLRGKIVGEALFGLVSVTLLDVSTPRIPVPVSFRECDLAGLFGSVNHFDTTSSAKAGLTLGAQFPSSLLTSGPISTLLDLLPPAFCAFFSTTDNALAAPQPGYDEPGRPVIGVASNATPPTTTPPVQTNPDPQDLTVSTLATRCGLLNVRDLHVTSSGFLLAGTSGSDPVTGASCNGRLTINARKVTVDSGGVISATGRISGGAGQPGSLGGGASHSGSGGNSGAGGAGSNINYGAGTDNDADDGSQGGTGTSGAAGGLGGGSLVVTAQTAIDVNGTIRANGSSGTSVSAGSCNTGGGGGSGGRIHLAASRIQVSGLVTADGGSGGGGGHGGGGGGGGRIQLDRIALQDGGSLMGAIPNSRVHANGGGAGAASGAGCNPGQAGGNGNPNLGHVLDAGAGVEVTNTNANGFVRGSASLHLTAVNPDGGPIELIYCRRSAPTSDADGFSSAVLDPGNTSVSSRLNNDNCATRDFSGPTSNGVEYEADVTDPGLGNAYYGYYAFVAYEIIPFLGDCTTFNGASCFYQSTLPTKAQARMASDNVAPTAQDPIVTLSGSTTNCPDGRACQVSAVGRAKILPQDDFSGVDVSACRVNGVPADGFPINPCRGSNVAVFLGSDGAKDVHVRFTDRAGNEKIFDDDLKYFVDSRGPAKPTILVNYSDASVNGWHKVKPDVSVLSGDQNPSAGWSHNPIQFFVDGGGEDCGGDPTVGAVASCGVSELEPSIPDEGIHQFDALATDLLGNESPRVDDPNITTDDIVMKVDHTKPTSKLFLGPNDPDGQSGWYKSQPVIAFAASDTPGGSGVDLDGNTNPSGVFFNIDGGADQLFDPDFGGGADQVVPNGVHTVCWHAVDVAGNAETQQCKANIKVDDTDPQPVATVAAPVPDGSNGWYVSTPHFAISAGDGAGSGVDQALNPKSGIFYSIDGEPFQRYDAGDPNLIGEGDRELCWYAIDVAGNLGGSGTHDAASCRRLKVDTTRPPLVRPYLDPSANDGTNGWYTSRPSVDFAQLDNEGGSGGQSSGSTAPAGTRFSVDGGPFVAWDPSDNAANSLPDGSYALCWRGVDVAGNGTAVNAGCQPVKVDTKAPTALAPIVPAAPDGANSYYVTQPKISPSATDPAGGSGIDRVEAQVDGGPWTVSASVVIPEGEHEVRVRAVDKAGNFSPIVEQTVRYDGTDPSGFPATFPPSANDRGWFRQPAHQSIAVEDGRDASGEDGATYQVDGGGQVSYLTPFDIGEGNHTLTIRPRDRAGRVGTPVTMPVRVDLTPPVPQPTGQPRTILLPFQSTTFTFTVSDNLSGKVRVRVELIDELGNVVQELAVPGDANGYIPTGAGSVAWNGSLANGKKALPGLYHFRVEAVDEAGNSAQSTEGNSMLLVLGAGTL